MSQFIKETARAWGISEKEVKDLHDWVEEKVPPQYQALNFANLLRKKRVHKPLIEEPPKVLTKEYIESKPHNKAQLAAWGISWPPPKGWKKKLLS